MAACSFDGQGLPTDARLGDFGPDSRADAGDLGPDQGHDLEPDVAADLGDAFVVDAGDLGLDVGPDVGPDLAPDLPPPPTCTDNKKNGAETDVDCGGPTCGPCGFNKVCGVLGDCQSPLLCDATTKRCRNAENCAELKQARSGLTTGTYTIKPLATQPAVVTKCDMVTDGGGWTLIMRTVWDWNDTQQLMTGWADFYGKKAGATSGAFRIPGVLWERLALGGKLLTEAVPRALSGGDCSVWRYVQSGGALTVDAAAKTMTLAGLQPKSLANGTQLSTTDSGPSLFCVNNIKVVPWFLGNCCVMCPTVDAGYWGGTPRPAASVAVLAKPGLSGASLSNACPPGQGQTSSNGSLALNSLSFYLK